MGIVRAMALGYGTKRRKRALQALDDPRGGAIQDGGEPSTTTVHTEDQRSPSVVMRPVAYCTDRRSALWFSVWVGV